jgi:hypothetical protein
MVQHVAQNPCLLAEWQDLRERLQSAGWARIDRNGVIAGYGLEFSKRYLNPAWTAPSCQNAGDGANALRPELEMGLEPGLHLFVSKAAVVNYIAR